LNLGCVFHCTAKRELEKWLRGKIAFARDDYLKRLRSGDLDFSVRREALYWIWKVVTDCFTWGLLGFWWGLEGEEQKEEVDSWRNLASYNLAC
jgi:hypothetical protein